MKEACRICGRELCGNQRRWIFHPAAKLSLQVLLSHAVGRDLSRDGRGEFACSKCAFLLERMYRFDTVIARVEALSLERLQKLLQEKERLRRGVGGLYRRNNPGEGGGEEAELCALQEAGYSDLIQEDLVFSVYESWADKEDPALDQHLLHCTGADAGHKPRRCRGCAALRVADSDYEAVCKVPRSLGRRSTSCGPSTRCSAAALGVEEVPRSSEGAADPPLVMESHSPASSLESLEIPTNPRDKEEADPEEAPGRRDPLWRKAQTEFSLPGMEALLGLLRGWEYRPVTPPRGSRLLTPPARSPCGGGPGPWELHPHPAVPEVVVLGPERELQEELEELEEQWLDDYVQCGPFRFQQVPPEPDRNMELQLRSAREEAQQQDRSVQNLTDSLRSKEAEVRRCMAAHGGAWRCMAVRRCPEEGRVSELVSGSRLLSCAERWRSRTRRWRLSESSPPAARRSSGRSVPSSRHDVFLSLLQRAVDERFRSAEEKEEEARRLQLLLRQKDVDLERQRCVLANNEETIASLEALLRGKALELEQVSDAWRSAQKQQREAEERQERVLRERDAVIDQLQAALLDRTQEVHSAPGQVLEELKVRLQLKDRLFQAVMSDRTRLAQEHQDQVQYLLRAVGARDRYIQVGQRSGVQALRRQLSSAGRLDRLSRSLDAKDELIRVSEREPVPRRWADAPGWSCEAVCSPSAGLFLQDLHRQMAAPSDLPLVERLTQEVQELREVLVRHGAAESGGGHQGL
uniref:Uncharacterized protein n=1 Tax=Fundulus heteroclitus TaxID=8078 RepID=A0A3Q2P6V1_FUNHE